MTKSQARDLRALLFSWLPEEPDRSESTPDVDNINVSEEPTIEEQRDCVLALLEQVRESTAMLDRWADRLIRVASAKGATNPEIGAALGVGKERIRRRLLKEPGAA